MMPSTPLSNQISSQPSSRNWTQAEQTRRICFLGESVAAGYLYAPYLTPAQVLQEQLRSVEPTVDYKVIDLARTNETLAGLLAQTRQAAELQPHLLVIFAGNNWNLLETPTVSPYFPRLAAKQAVAAAMRDAGVLGPIEVAARQRLEKAVATLAEIHALTQVAHSEVILVVPEVNLADWWSHQPVVWRPGQATAQWYQHYFQAEQQLAQGAWPAAVATAQAMIALDGSTCPTPYRLLVRAYMGLQEWSAASNAGRLELDSDQYASLALMSAPRITPLEQAILRRSAVQYGFRLVDLPPIFAHYTGSPLPDRRLFLDYCHLTAEGMKVSMAAVTAAILRAQGRTDDCADWQALLSEVPEPTRTAAVDATAHFGAAIHTAHRLVGPKQPLLHHWCQAALASSAAMGATMLDFVRARLAACPIVLTGAHQRNLQQEVPLGVQQGWRYAYLDHAMIQAIEATLVAAKQITAAEFAHLFLGATAQQVELAQPAFYHWEPLARFYPDVIAAAELEQPAFYRSPWPRSSFCLLSDGRRPIDLALIARLPPASRLSTANFELWVNGQQVQRAPITPRWRQASLQLSPKPLRAGINQVEIRWPYQALLAAQDGVTALEATAARLERGLEAHLHPVFGEIFSFTATHLGKE